MRPRGGEPRGSLFLRANRGPTLLLYREKDRGYLPLDSMAANVFFHLVSRRYGRASIILTSNKSYAEWTRGRYRFRKPMFKDYVTERFTFGSKFPGSLCPCRPSAGEDRRRDTDFRILGTARVSLYNEAWKTGRYVPCCRKTKERESSCRIVQFKRLNTSQDLTAKENLLQ